MKYQRISYFYSPLKSFTCVKVVERWDILHTRCEPHPHFFTCNNSTQERHMWMRKGHENLQKSYGIFAEIIPIMGMSEVKGCFEAYAITVVFIIILPIYNLHIIYYMRVLYDDSFRAESLEQMENKD